LKATSHELSFSACSFETRSRKYDRNRLFFVVGLLA